MVDFEGTPPAEQEPPEDRGGGVLSAIRDRINWPATVAVSAAATLAASVAFHEADFPEGSTMQSIQRFMTPDAFGIDYHTTTSRQYVRRHTVRHRQTNEYGSRADNFYLNRSGQAYARDFSRDPAAGEYTDPNELDTIVGNLAGNVREGYDIKGIRITGYASAEDDGPDGGLTAPSEKNLGLARKRATVVEEELRQAIEDNPSLSKATRDASFTYGEPVEQELTEDQAGRIEKMAKKAGFDDARQLIDAWNTGQADVPEADREALAGILGNARKVEVHVSYGHPSRDVTVERKYCVRYNINAIRTHKHHQRDPLPLPVPLLIPVPRLRRKTRGGPSDGEEPEPDVLGPEPEPAAEPDETPAEQSGKQEVFAEAEGVPVSDRSVVQDEPLLPRYTPETAGRRNRSYRIANTIAGFTGALFAAGVLFVNVSGKNCHGDGHTPRPWLVDGIWEAIDDASGRGADVSQTISIGIPFVSGAQLDLKEVQGNVWTLDGEKACERPAPAAAGPLPKPPRCSQVDIVRRNGKTVSKRTVYQAPPISTKRIVRQHR